MHILILWVKYQFFVGKLNWSLPEDLWSKDFVLYPVTDAHGNTIMCTLSVFKLVAKPTLTTAKNILTVARLTFTLARYPPNNGDAYMSCIPRIFPILMASEGIWGYVQLSMPL